MPHSPTAAHPAPPPTKAQLVTSLFGAAQGHARKSRAALHFPGRLAPGAVCPLRDSRAAAPDVHRINCLLRREQHCGPDRPLALPTRGCGSGGPGAVQVVGHRRDHAVCTAAGRAHRPRRCGIGPHGIGLGTDGGARRHCRRSPSAPGTKNNRKNYRTPPCPSFVVGHLLFPRSLPRTFRTTRCASFESTTNLVRQLPHHFGQGQCLVFFLSSLPVQNNNKASLFEPAPTPLRVACSTSTAAVGLRPWSS